MWARIGTIIVVIAAVLAFVVAVAQLLQSMWASNAQDILQVTLLAIEEEQLKIHREQATLQASGLNGGPTTTAVARRAAELESTAAALATRQIELAATLASDSAPSSISTNTPTTAPALTPVSINTPVATSTPTLTRKPTPIATVTAQPQPTIGQTPHVRATPPIPAPLGWAYEQDGVQLSLIEAEIRTNTDIASAAARLLFAILNKSSQRLLVEFDQSQVYITDSAGARYVDYEGPGIQSFWLESGESNIIERYYSAAPQHDSRISPSAMPVTVHIDKLSKVNGAQWIIGGSPIYTYSDGEAAGSLGNPLGIDDFEVILTDLEVRTTEDVASAAFRALFSVRNKSSQRKLLELDYAYIYIEDNFGTRYVDYDGVGLFSTWIDPGQEFEFERFYSTQYQTPSRIPIGTSYAIVICEGISNGARAVWRVDIAR